MTRPRARFLGTYAQTYPQADVDKSESEWIHHLAYHLQRRLQDRLL